MLVIVKIDCFMSIDLVTNKKIIYEKQLEQSQQYFKTNTRNSQNKEQWLKLTDISMLQVDSGHQNMQAQRIIMFILKYKNT